MTDKKKARQAGQSLTGNGNYKRRFICLFAFSRLSHDSLKVQQSLSKLYQFAIRLSLPQVPTTRGDKWTLATI